MANKQKSQGKKKPCNIEISKAPVTAKRNAKDTVFRNLFEKPEYLLQLYKALHPDDTDITGDMFQNVTIQNILTDRLYNDLGFIVRDRLMILVEAQSTWSVNIVIRAFMYLAQTYQDRFRQQECNLYSITPVELPEPELYVIYTGDRGDHPDVMTLSKEFFKGKTTALDVTVRILYGEDRTTIIGQYVRFCKVFNEQVELYGRTAKAVMETVQICKDEDVLKTYLTAHEQEAFSIMMALFDQDSIQRAYGRECERKGRAEGRAEGKIEGKIKTLIDLVQDKLLSVGDAARKAGMSEADFISKMNESAAKV